MAQRDDITVRWDLLPRLIIIAAPSTEITIQDLVDTLREIEARPQNMIYPSIISAAGGENLGGGVSVGFTATLINAQIFFESRYTRTSSGISTTTDVAGGVLFEDIGATFITDGVARGATITNFDDQSYATVLEVLSQTQLLHEPLSDGYTNAWASGDSYKVHNEIQCNISGGNLVAVDYDGLDINAISPSAFTQIVRASSSSATNQNSADIEVASFNGRVTIDLDNITGLASSGTTFPAGTRRQPCDNLEDALAICSSRGFDTLFVLGNATIDSGLIYDNFTFIGEHKAKTHITISPDASVYGCEIEQAIVTGTLDGYSTFRECLVSDLLFFNGTIENCGLSGTITLDGNAQATIVNCYDNKAGLGTPTIDMGGAGQSLIIANYFGGIKIIHKTGNDDISINVASARVILDSTVTAGNIIIRGTGELEDNSTADVNSLNLVNGLKLAKIAYGEFVHLDPILGTAGTILGTNGIPTNPSDNFSDALTLSDALNLRSFRIMSSEVHIHQNISNKRFVGTGSSFLHLDGYLLDGCVFENIRLAGIFNYTTGAKENRPHFYNCPLIELAGISGVGTNCILSGYIGLKTNESLLLSHVTTEERNDTEEVLTSPTTLDVNGGEVVIQDLDGYLLLKNVNSTASTAIISMNSAHVYIDPSCTDGTIIIRGNGQVTNAGTSDLNTGGTLAVNSISSDTFRKLFPFVAG